MWGLSEIAAAIGHYGVSHQKASYSIALAAGAVAGLAFWHLVVVTHKNQDATAKLLQQQRADSQRAELSITFRDKLERKVSPSDPIIWVNAEVENLGGVRATRVRARIVARYQMLNNADNRGHDAAQVAQMLDVDHPARPQHWQDHGDVAPRGRFPLRFEYWPGLRRFRDFNKTDLHVMRAVVEATYCDGFGRRRRVMQCAYLQPHFDERIKPCSGNVYQDLGPCDGDSH